MLRSQFAESVKASFAVKLEALDLLAVAFFKGAAGSGHSSGPEPGARPEACPSRKLRSSDSARTCAAWPTAWPRVQSSPPPPRKVGNGRLENSLRLASGIDQQPGGPGRGKPGSASTTGGPPPISETPEAAGKRPPDPRVSSRVTGENAGPDQAQYLGRNSP